MNFLIAGHSVVDKIIDGEHQAIKPGGIFYSVVSLLSLLEQDDKIFLCSNVDEENSELFEFVYNKVEKKFVRKIKSIPFVELKVNGHCERNETYSQLAENLILPEDNLNNFSGILVNMITGYDLSLTQLKKLRDNFNGLIYFDVHTLSRGVDRNLSRDFRMITDFYKWAECVDILQANESELKTLSTKKTESEIAKELLSFGIKQVVITRSERGASVFIKENEYVKRIDANALKVKTVNKVGCGDVFGAVFFYNYIKNRNIPLALEQANIYAGIATTYADAKDFLNLQKDASEWLSKK
jgi:sugar/nucleoside kinase (ribokinase family)